MLASLSIYLSVCRQSIRPLLSFSFVLPSSPLFSISLFLSLRELDEQAIRSSPYRVLSSSLLPSYPTTLLPVISSLVDRVLQILQPADHIIMFFYQTTTATTNRHRRL